MSQIKKRFHFNFIKNFYSGYEEDTVLHPKTNFETHIYKARKTRFYKGNSFYGYSKGGYKSSYDFKEVKQFCTFISSHRYEKILNKKNFDYIQKEGKGLNGADPELYGADPEGYEKRMAKLSFRWIVSPDNPSVDLNVMVKELIRRVEINTGYKLDWVAANHYNTDQPHAHILINGFDLNRKKVNFSNLGKDYISHVIREHCRDICTEQVGTRTTEEREETYQRQTVGNYFTELDRQIDKFLLNSNRVKFDHLQKAYNSTLLHKRLVYLTDIKLAKYDKSSNLYIFKNDWKEQLKIYSKYNTFLEGLRFTKAHQSRYSLHDIDKLGVITGKVVKRYFMQENSNNHAVILETKPDHFLYIPLFEAPVNAPVGKNVKIEFQRLNTPTGGSRKTMIITNV